MKAKWKIGVLLMAIVFCVALIPPLVSGARAGSSGGLKKELAAVVQLDNEQAVLNGNLFPLETAAPYQDETGVTMVPLKVVANAMGAELTWDTAAEQAVLSGGDSEVGFKPGSVVLSGGEQALAPLETAPVINDGVIFVPASDTARTMAWQYYE